MKRFIYLPIYILLAVAMTAAFASCTEDEVWDRPSDMSTLVPEYFADITNGNMTISGTTVAIDYTLVVHARFDYWKLKVNKVEYYIDDQLISSSTTEPYPVRYTAQNVSKGTHNLIARVFIKDLVSMKEFTKDVKETFEVKIDGNHDSGGDSNKESLYVNYSYTKVASSINIDVTSTFLPSEKQRDGWSIRSVSYYLNSDFIEKTSTEPYEFHYVWRDAPAGDNVLGIDAEIYNSKDGSTDKIHRDIKL